MEQTHRLSIFKAKNDVTDTQIINFQTNYNITTYVMYNWNVCTSETLLTFMCFPTLNFQPNTLKHKEFDAVLWTCS